MYVTSAVDLTKLCVFIVIKSTSAVTNQTAFDARPNTDFDYNSVDGCALFLDPPSNIRFYGQQPIGRLIQIAADSSTTKLLSFQSSDISLDGWSNGTSQTSATFTTPRTNTAKGFSIGASWNGSSYDNITCTATIYEIIVYNTVLSDNQRQSVEGYLAKKWALTVNLPGTHIGLKSTYVTPSWLTTIPYGLYSTSIFVATGGTITIANGYKTHTFTTVGTTNFVVTQVLQTGFSVQLLVVGGGGGGGVNCAGGGGAGGAIFVTSQTVTSGSYSIVVGGGGSGGIDPFAPLYGAVGSNGTTSTGLGYTGIGGGGGGWSPQSASSVVNGIAGGCGGGGAGYNPAGTGGTSLQAGGFAGGNGAFGNVGGGGGGGMGSVGSNGSGNIAGSGGNGATYTIGGTAYTLAGGGGGGAASGSTTSSGGSGGGGFGAQVTNASGGDATYYGSGGGGGAGGGGAPKGGDGYQGIVIISYPF